jgi:hypothetical protein
MNDLKALGIHKDRKTIIVNTFKKTIVSKKEYNIIIQIHLYYDLTLIRSYTVNLNDFLYIKQPTITTKTLYYKI